MEQVGAVLCCAGAGAGAGAGVGLPTSQPRRGGVLLSLWDEEVGSAVRMGVLAGVPTKDNPGPLFTTQMVSSASLPSHPASCLSILPPLAKRITDMAPPPPSTAVLVPVLKDVGCLVALY